ncbi:YbaN family protein [Staphylococcus felis]|uniref:YbaN family protein n=1 Tax=Staphylococcus felis TaxID=46127 RepID=UPI003966B07B
MKPLLITIGILFSGLGFLGVILPLLPTTPFLLVAVICFSKSSDRFHDWLVQTKMYRTYVESFRKYRGYSMPEKIKLLVSLVIVVGFSIIMISNTYIRIGLSVMLIMQTIILFTVVKTLPKSYRETNILNKE